MKSTDCFEILQARAQQQGRKSSSGIWKTMCASAT